MENVRNHVDVKLLTKWDSRYGAEAMISKPNFHSCSIFSENLITVELRKLEVKFNKPIYVGMCILDISKSACMNFTMNTCCPCTVTSAELCILIATVSYTTSSARMYMRL
ncbi:PREDICTED: uncharacterized protein LOC105556496 [Vollenhovia emeryi]|uniref:uncharacterized protein LOC105556496 n=1 Tax=Vollenhovia emeryi TaxID=411798 RepID=UPI0005F4CF1C|nr:PREDICTED: uncharacterized protein LOC105556496 [Vollenhovia emeryi]